MPLFRSVFDTKGFYSEQFYPEQFLIQMVLIPKGRFFEIWNKNRSDQKPFRSKTPKIIVKFQLLTVVKSDMFIRL